MFLNIYLVWPHARGNMAATSLAAAGCSVFEGGNEQKIRRRCLSEVRQFYSIHSLGKPSKTRGDKSSYKFASSFCKPKSEPLLFSRKPTPSLIE